MNPRVSKNTIVPMQIGSGRRLVGSTLAGLATAAVFFSITKSFNRADSLVYEFFVLPAAIAAASVVGSIALRKIAKYSSSTALFVSASTGLAMYAGMIITGRAFAADYTAILAYPLSFFAFRLGKSKLYRNSLFLVILVLISTGMYLQTNRQKQNLYNEELAKLPAIPTYVVEGYKLEYIREMPHYRQYVKKPTGGYLITEGRAPTINYTKIAEDGGWRTYSLQYQDITDEFNPPTNCSNKMGIVSSGESQMEKCRQIGTTKDGTSIYGVFTEKGKLWKAKLVVGDKLLDINLGSLGEAEAMRIINSLEKPQSK